MTHSNEVTGRLGTLVSFAVKSNDQVAWCYFKLAQHWSYVACHGQANNTNNPIFNLECAGTRTLHATLMLANMEK